MQRKMQKKVMSFWRKGYKEEIRRLPEPPKTQKILPEFYQQELATLMIGTVDNVHYYTSSVRAPLSSSVTIPVTLLEGGAIRDHGPTRNNQGSKLVVVVG